MLTDPKSGDYLAWFFCTKEQSRGQMAYFSRMGCLLDHHLRSSQEETVVRPEDFEAVSPYPPADGLLIKRTAKKILSISLKEPEHEPIERSPSYGEIWGRLEK